ARQQAPGVGWGQALADPAIARVVSRMQAEPQQPWTLERLARDAGLSRTALAERFREAMGDTPLNHLRTLRMQRAMHLLSETDDTLERIAQAVGYTDAFSFSKVFKRVTGQAPAEFRRRDAAERAQPGRRGERVSA
ncbi:MAG: helix-turn-helix domain-containing protein, partial [Rubrivivax sp.]